MQLVFQQLYFKNWICLIRDVTLCNVSCNLSRNPRRGWDLVSNGKFSLAAQQKYYNIARRILHCAMAIKFVVVLWQHSENFYFVQFFLQHFYVV